jgi:putative membrane protein
MRIYLPVPLLIPFFLLANCPLPSLFLFETAIYFLLDSILPFSYVFVYNHNDMANPYSKFSEKELILRDHLAIDRTVLSNERTILSYARTGLAIMAAGATLIHFFSGSLSKIVGILLIILGLIIIFIGLYRYKKMKDSIDKIKRT